MFNDKNKKEEKIIKETLSEHEKEVQEIFVKTNDNIGRLMFRALKSVGLVDQVFLLGYKKGRIEGADEVMEKVLEMTTK